MADVIALLNNLEAEAKASYEYLAESFAHDISLNIYREMEKKGWKGKDLASAMRVKPARISQITNGSSNVTIATLAKVAHALGCEIHNLVAEIKETEIIFQNAASDCIAQTLSQVTDWESDAEFSFYEDSNVLPVDKPSETNYDLYSGPSSDFDVVCDYIGAKG